MVEQYLIKEWRLWNIFRMEMSFKGELSQYLDFLRCYWTLPFARIKFIMWWRNHGSVFAETFSEMNLAFLCPKEECNEVNILEVPLQSVIVGAVVIVLVPSRNCLFAISVAGDWSCDYKMWRNCCLPKLYSWTCGSAIFREATAMLAFCGNLTGCLLSLSYVYTTHTL